LYSSVSGYFPVVPQIGRDVFLGVLAGFGVEVLEQPLQGPDQRVTDALDDAGMSQGEWGGRDPAGDDDDHRGGKNPKPLQE
jgi:hypothetical protein